MKTRSSREAGRRRLAGPAIVNPPTTCWAASLWVVASLALPATPAVADVLAPGEYVVSYKLSYGTKQKDITLESGRIDTVDQTTWTHRLTGVIGLGILPWQHHLFASTGLKAIDRVAQMSRMEFADIAFVDTKVAVQHLIYEYQPQYDPMGFQVSLRTGLNVPTTPEGYRVVEKVENPVDEDLIETHFDKGTLGYILGASFSGYYRYLWSDFELGVAEDFDGEWFELSGTLGLGVSLSRQWAVQSSLSRVSTIELGVGKDSTELGLGAMFNYSDQWSFGAGGYRTTPDDGGTENSYYVSLRTQSL